jgi:release factor glutamine methyltransferase
VSTVGGYLARARGDARRDLEVLLAHVLGRSRAWLYAHGEYELAITEAARLDALLARSRGGEPIAYLTGQREFFGLALDVGPEVLVPRPETELLVEACLRGIGPGSAVLEVGTGSGAIALALAHAQPAAHILATDIDRSALAVARANAARLGIAVEFLLADLYAGLAPRRFHAIVSNPPYVAEGDPHLAALDCEPRHALVAGADGFAVLRPLIAGAPLLLEGGGRLLVEHGAGQGARVRALFAAAGFASVETERDLAGHERVTLGTK